MSAVAWEWNRSLTSCTAFRACVSRLLTEWLAETGLHLMEDERGHIGVRTTVSETAVGIEGTC